jgi:hypothetical protein
VAAFKAGMAVACNLNLGGFDTHGNHDRDQVLQIAKLLKGVDFLMKEAEMAGIADDLVVMIGSDFARGPGYNGGPRQHLRRQGPLVDHQRHVHGPRHRQEPRHRRPPPTTSAPAPSTPPPSPSRTAASSSSPSPSTGPCAPSPASPTANLAKQFPLAGDDMPKLLTG